METRVLSRLDWGMVARVLGCGQEAAVPEPTRRQAERLLAELVAIAEPRHVHGTFALERTAEGIRLAGTGLTLPGRDIAALLAGCDACLLLAATLGIQADRAIDAVQRRSMAETVLLDALAGALIEAYVEETQSALAADLPLTRRYSPGYGDLPLALQPMLLAVLNAPRRIGLHCNPRCLMIPRKSVTAVIGIGGGAASAGRADSCARCGLAAECQIRKAGGRCGR
jgi:hypothetical protein